MARILLCWELGGGLGHLVPLAEAGRDLEQAGHTVAYALRDLAYASSLLNVDTARLYQAPLLLPIWRDNGVLPASFPDILHSIGYRDARWLQGLIAGWRRIYADFQPDVIVHDHSPTSMLASRDLDVPAIGLARSGFTLPPPAAPMPLLREVDTREVHARENDVTNVINEALQSFDLPAIDSVDSLFRLQARILLSLPELDPYGPRKDVEYWGPLEHGLGEKPEWPESDGKRVFVYTKRFETLNALLDTLAGSGASVLAHVSGMDAAECERRSTATLHLNPRILDIRDVLKEADLLVTHGGSMVSAALLAGKPVLTLPLYLEQQLTGAKLQALGAGLNAPQRLPAGMRQKLSRLLKDDSFTAAAESIAAANTHRNLLSEGFNRRFADLVEHLLG